MQGTDSDLESELKVWSAQVTDLDRVYTDHGGRDSIKERLSSHGVTEQPGGLGKGPGEGKEGCACSCSHLYVCPLLPLASRASQQLIAKLGPRRTGIPKTV